MAEGEDEKRERPKRLPSFRPPSAGRTDVVGRVPKNIKTSVSEPPVVAQAGRPRALPPLEDKRLIGSDPPPAAVGVDVEVVIPSTSSLTDLDPVDLPIDSGDDEGVAMRRGRAIPGTREPTEKVVRPVEPESVETDGSGAGKWLAVVAVACAAAVVIGVFLTLPDETNRSRRTETEPATASATPTEVAVEAETETGATPEAETETEAETEAETETETEGETEGESGSGEVVDPDAPIPEPSIDDLAALPTPRPEVGVENPWVRRNRAADIRQEARRQYMNGRLVVAHGEFLHSLEWDPENVDAMRYLSRTLQRLGDLDAALAWARRAVRSEPDNPRNHELLGDQLLMLDRTDDAIAAYNVGLERAPRDRRLRSRLRRLQ